MIEPLYAPLHSPTGSALWIYFSHDGSRLFGGGTGPFVWIWDVAQQALVDQIDTGARNVLHASLHPARDWLVGNCGDHLRVWDMAALDEIQRMAQPSYLTGSVSCGYDTVACALHPESEDENSRLQVFDLASGQARGAPHPIESRAHGVAIAPDGRFVGAIHRTGTGVWNAAWEQVLHFPGLYDHGGAGQAAITFTRDGWQVWVTYRGGPHLRTWDLSADPPRLLLETSLGGPAFRMALSPDECVLAVSLYREIVLIDTATYAILARWPVPENLRPTGPLNKVVFSPDGWLLATVCESRFREDDGTLRPIGGIALWPVPGVDVDGDAALG